MHLLAAWYDLRSLGNPFGELYDWLGYVQETLVQALS